MNLIFQSVYHSEHAPPPDHYRLSLYRSNAKREAVLSSRFWGLRRRAGSRLVTRCRDNDNYYIFVIWSKIKTIGKISMTSNASSILDHAKYTYKFSPCVIRLSVHSLETQKTGEIRSNEIRIFLKLRPVWMVQLFIYLDTIIY